MGEGPASPLPTDKSKEPRDRSLSLSISTGSLSPRWHGQVVVVSQSVPKLDTLEDSLMKPLEPFWWDTRITAGYVSSCSITPCLAQAATLSAPCPDRQAGCCGCLCRFPWNASDTLHGIIHALSARNVFNRRE